MLLSCPVCDACIDHPDNSTEDAPTCCSDKCEQHFVDAFRVEEVYLIEMIFTRWCNRRNKQYNAIRYYGWSSPTPLKSKAKALTKEVADKLASKLLRDRTYTNAKVVSYLKDMS